MHVSCEPRQTRRVWCLGLSSSNPDPPPRVPSLPPKPRRARSESSACESTTMGGFSRSRYRLPPSMAVAAASSFPSAACVPVAVEGGVSGTVGDGGRREAMQRTRYPTLHWLSTPDGGVETQAAAAERTAAGRDDDTLALSAPPRCSLATLAP